MFDRDAYFAELDEYYSTYPRYGQDLDLSRYEPEWRRRLGLEPGASPFRQKAMIYEVAADRCGVHLFRRSPFYHEINAGRPRNHWGLENIGAMMRRMNAHMLEDVHRLIEPFDREGLFSSFVFIDWDHHCVGYDNVLAHGLLGLRRMAEERLQGADEESRAFLSAVVAGMDCLMQLASTFADRAEEMLRDETDPDVRASLSRIADTARRVPANPPKTFYEALNTILFMREACSSLEGIAISVFGQVDRMLWPYYQADLEAGRITREEAKDLLRVFLSYTDARFERSALHETSTTVNIGGQDREGSPVFNDITRMICEVYEELGIVGTKLNARVCREHPREYYDLLAKTALCGVNALAVFNDEALVKAHADRGKAIEDCRLYVNGGCQEPVLQNTEVNFRANIYFNLLKPLEMTLYPDRWSEADKARFVLSDRGPSCTGFDEFYSVLIANLKVVFDGVSAMAAGVAPRIREIGPCPMTSATISDCIEKGKDLMEGGARYNSYSISLNGLPTLLDSVYGIKHLVYDRGMLSLDELKQVLDADYEGREELRRYILREVPKYGRDDDDFNAFAARLAGDIADAASGQDGGRGGTFEASLFTYGWHRHWGEQTPATPDGRRAGEWFARGMTPSEGDAAKGLTAVVNSACALPMDKYPGGGVLDITLPVGMGSRTDILSAVIRRFVEGGGSILQVNSLDKDVLLDAKASPEKHPALVVRVWGFSAYFTTLPENIQDEIIARTVQGE